jgi:hypothetical protein
VKEIALKAALSQIPAYKDKVLTVSVSNADLELYHTALRATQKQL